MQPQLSFMETSPLCLPDGRGCIALGSLITEDTDTATINTALENAGWMEVGDGCYCTVFISPDADRVLKFAQGGGQLATLAVAEAMPDNPHLPKVFGVLRSAHGYDYVAEMEALEPLDVAEYDYDGDFDADYSEDSRALADFWGRFGRNLETLTDAEPDGGPLEAAVAALQCECRRRGLYWDAHDGNFMRRPSDGTLVLNDLLA